MAKIKTLDEFKKKWANEIKLGIVQISDDDMTIDTDRFGAYHMGTDIICEKIEMGKIQAYIRSLGYEKTSAMGQYSKHPQVSLYTKIENFGKNYTRNLLPTKDIIQKAIEDLKSPETPCDQQWLHMDGFDKGAQWVIDYINQKLA